MNYRYDIAQEQKRLLNVSYGELERRSGVPRQVLCDTVRGETTRNGKTKPTNPTTITIVATFEALELDPKLALDFKYKLKKRGHRRAVNRAAR